MVIEREVVARDRLDPGGRLRLPAIGAALPRRLDQMSCGDAAFPIALDGVLELPSRPDPWHPQVH